MSDDTTQRHVKQVIVIRRDLNMRRGKEIAQGAHASMMWLTSRLEENRHYDSSEGGAYVECELIEPERRWVKGNFRKVTCQVPDEDLLLGIVAKAHAIGVMAHLVQDSGLTEFDGVETTTAAAIGPAWEDDVDKVTGTLSLY